MNTKFNVVEETIVKEKEVQNKRNTKLWDNT